MNTRVIDPQRERAVIGQPTYSQQPVYAQQPVAVTAAQPGVTYEFPTFDPHRVPTYTHAADAYQPVEIVQPQQPVYSSPSRVVQQPTYSSPSRVAQPQYVAQPYQPVLDTQPYTTVPIEVAAPQYASPSRAPVQYSSPSRAPAQYSSPSRQQPTYSNSGRNNNGGYQVETTTRIYM